MLEATYAVNLRLTGKPVVDLVLVIIEHFSFSLGVVFLKAVGHFGPKF